MKRLFSLLMLCSLALTTQLINAGCACDGSSRKMSRRERRAQRHANNKQIQARSKTKKRKTKAAPAKPAPVKKAIPSKAKKSTPAKAGKVHIVKSKADLDALKAKGKTVVVKYSADWCGACKVIEKYFQELAGEFKDFVFVTVNTDKDGGLSRDVGVKALPTIHIHKGGKKQKTGELVGANKEALHSLVKSHA